MYNDKRREATGLRKRGMSYKKISKRLSVPLSTLSGWLKDIELTDTQRKKLEADWRQGLVKARVKAAHWHREQKKQRLVKAASDAKDSLKNISSEDKYVVELALALLYLGEGTKGDKLALGNSNPLILQFFLSSLYRLYRITSNDVRCYMHLRADQDEQKLKRYWSKHLCVPLKRFGKTSFDKRTMGRPTYPTYKGVCLVECSRVAIQRRLMYIANGFCARVAHKKPVGG